MPPLTFLIGKESCGRCVRCSVKLTTLVYLCLNDYLDYLVFSFAGVDFSLEFPIYILGSTALLATLLLVSSGDL